MKKAKTGESVIALLKSSMGIIFTHKLILFPFLIIAAAQFFILTILYFYPLFPLDQIFGPIVSKIWSPQYMHYPQNFVLLPKLYQYIQIPIYIFISSFFICVSISIIHKINEGLSINLRLVFEEIGRLYVHIIVASAIAFVMVWYFFSVYQPIYERALAIRSQTGMFHILKSIVVNGTSYFNLLWSVLITTLTAYVLPIIVIEKAKVFTAIWRNIVFLTGSFWQTVGIILLPSLLFMPVLWLRNVFSIEFFLPEFSFLTLIISVLLTVIIDAVIYTTLTSYYLWKIEQQTES